MGTFGPVFYHGRKSNTHTHARAFVLDLDLRHGERSTDPNINARARCRFAQKRRKHRRACAYDSIVSPKLVIMGKRHIDFSRLTHCRLWQKSSSALLDFWYLACRNPCKAGSWTCPRRKDAFSAHPSSSACLLSHRPIEIKKGAGLMRATLRGFFARRVFFSKGIQRFPCREPLKCTCARTQF